MKRALCLVILLPLLGCGGESTTHTPTHPAYERGVRDAKGGFTMDQCPYSDSWYSAEERERWMLGWMDAKRKESK